MTDLLTTLAALALYTGAGAALGWLIAVVVTYIVEY